MGWPVLTSILVTDSLSGRGRGFLWRTTQWPRRPELRTTRRMLSSNLVSRQRLAKGWTTILIKLKVRKLIPRLYLAQLCQTLLGHLNRMLQVIKNPILNPVLNLDILPSNPNLRTWILG